MADVWGKRESYEDDGEGEEVGELRMGNDHIFILIDCRKAMFEKNRKGDSYFSCALRAAEFVLRRKVCMANKDRVGVCFFGSREKDEASTYDGVRTAVPLEVPSAQHIMAVQRLQEEAAFEERVGRAGDGALCPLKSAFWVASLAFNERKTGPFDTRRVWILTNDDDPFRGNDEEAQLCVRRARDALEADINIELWPLRSSGGDFDVKKFYEGMLASDGDEEDEDFDAVQERLYGGPGMDSYDEILRETQRRVMRKRCLARLLLYLGSPSRAQSLAAGSKGEDLAMPAADEVCVGVGLYNVVKKATRMSKVKLHRATNRAVRGVTRNMCSTSGEYLDADSILTYLEVGSDKAYITREEMKAIRAFGSGEDAPPPCVRLFGFRPLSFLRDDMQLGAPLFAVPEESAVKGSTAVLRALHAAMVEAGRLAIVSFRKTAVSTVRLAALVPQEEAGEGLAGHSRWAHEAPGFHLVPLPFMDYMRRTPEDKVERAAAGAVPEDLLGAAEQLVGALPLPNFSSANIHNPSLQKHYAQLHALALTEREPEWTEADDECVPDAEGFRRPDIQRAVDAFVQAAAVGGGVGAADDAAARKRAKKEEAASPSPSAKKRAKTG